MTTMRAALGALLLGAAPALAQGPAGTTSAEALAQGKQVAEAWCSNCHLIGPGTRGPTTDAAPPFHAIAAMPSTTEMSLRAFLSTPHVRMPDYHLTNQELDGLVAYILSQKTGQQNAR